MGMVICYSLRDVGGKRIPWALAQVVDDMMIHTRVFALALALLRKIYQELFMYTTMHRASIYVSIMLQAWSYGHITIAHPPGLPNKSYRRTCHYLSGVRR